MSKAKIVLTDEEWARIESILPPTPAVRGVGRPRLPDRLVMEAIKFVLETSTPWYLLPCEYGAFSSIHCRFKKWANAGLIQKIWPELWNIYRIKSGLQVVAGSGKPGRNTWHKTLKKQKQEAKEAREAAKAAVTGVVGTGTCVSKFKQY